MGIFPITYLRREYPTFLPLSTLRSADEAPVVRFDSSLLSVNAIELTFELQDLGNGIFERRNDMDPDIVSIEDVVRIPNEDEGQSRSERCLY